MNKAMKSIISILLLIAALSSVNLYSQAYRNYSTFYYQVFVPQTSDSIFNDFLTSTKLDKYTHPGILNGMFGGWLTHLLYNGRFDGINFYRASDSNYTDNSNSGIVNSPVTDKSSKLQPLKPIDITKSSDLTESTKKVYITKSEYISSENSSNNSEVNVKTSPTKKETYTKPYNPPSTNSSPPSSGNTNSGTKKGGNTGNNNQTQTKKKAD